MEEDWGRRKSLESAEGCSHLVRPLEGLDNGGETSEKSCHLTIVVDKGSLKVGEAQKALELLAQRWGGPLCHWVHLGRVRSKLPSLN